jgi:hypothetical protein
MCLLMSPNIHSDNRAMTSLNISDNNLGGYYDNNKKWVGDVSGVQALSAAIPECK